MTKKTNSVNLSEEAWTIIDDYKKEHDITSTSKALDQFITRKLDNISNMPNGNIELTNILHIMSFLTLKTYESVGNNGVVHMKEEELNKLLEFVRDCNNLIHNANFHRESIKNEGYKGLHEEIEKVRKYL